MRLITAVAMLCLGVAAPAAAQAEAGTPVRVMLFGDARFAWAEEADAGTGFSLGQAVGHMNAVLTDRLSVAVEATLTPRATAFAPSLERLILRYDFSDRFKLSAGRYHTPVSWWNTQYHHGLWLQTSIDRPQMVRFGTQLVPVHFLGLLAEGSIHAGPATFLYSAGIGNGRQENIGLPGDAGDVNRTAALVGALRIRPDALAGLELGVHTYLDEVDVGFGEVDERMFSGHIALSRGIEVIGEYLHIIHDLEAGGGSSGTDAYYTQLGWPLPPVPSLQPYVRFERIDVATGDPLFAGFGLDYEGVIAGLRWDFADFAALKGELRSEEFGGGERFASLVLNAAFVIPNITE